MPDLTNFLIRLGPHCNMFVEGDRLLIGSGDSIIDGRCLGGIVDVGLYRIDKGGVFHFRSFLLLRVSRDWIGLSSLIIN